jgi:uncharacterized protein (DUF885 family)
MDETLKVFRALCEEYVEVSLRHDPVAATGAGIHDYDDRFPDDTPDGLRERAAWLRDLEQRLVASVPWDELPTQARVDFALLRSRLAIRRAEIEEMRLHAKDPSRPLHTALNGVYLLLARPFAPLEDRKELLLARLMAIPDYLEAALAAITAPAPEMVAIAREVAETGPGFVDEVARVLIRANPGEAERVEHAARGARVGFLRYQEALDRDLAPRATGSFAIGERWMNFKLEREHLLSMDCAFLADFGRQQVAEARTRLEDEARRLDPAMPWRSQIERARRRAPEPLRVLDAYRAEVERARRFVELQRLAPLPADALEVVDTPAFLRPMVPVASYLRPAAFDVEHAGQFFVTTPDLLRPRAEQEETRRAHAEAAIPLMVVHESFPGHHVQSALGSAGGSRLRRLAESSLTSEGWAFYCEDLMLERGYLVAAETRLFALRDALWRACRVVIDIGLQTGRMTVEQAVALLTDEVMLGRREAEAEVKRYLLTPTEPLAFLVGRLLLREIRAETQRRLGSAFDLYDFHAALLGLGTIPPFLMREELWERMPAR